MRIIQMLPTIAYGDAIGNDTIALKKVLESLGYETGIYAESVVPPLNHKTAVLVEKLPKLTSDDIIIYHLSTGAKLNKRFIEYPAKKIIIYHNVTPPHFFEKNDDFIYGINKWALEDVKYLADKVDYCLADSEFNKRDLRSLGYTCPIDVLPILIPFDDYKKKPDIQIVNKYSDGKTNIVFTGRLVPNKKQEDIIGAFYYYKKYFDTEARLFLVGSYKPEDIYYRRLVKYVKSLNLKDVYFTGHIKFNEILAYFQIADVFLCMSEHEGFCVPLVEAMFFNIPIIAYGSTAVPSTLGGSGIIMEDKDPLIVAKMMHLLKTDEILRKKVVYNQKIRLEDFKYDKIKKQFEVYLNSFIGRNG